MNWSVYVCGILTFRYLTDTGRKVVNCTAREAEDGVH